MPNERDLKAEIGCLLLVAHLRRSWEWNPLCPNSRFQTLTEGPEPVYH